MDLISSKLAFVAKIGIHSVEASAQNILKPALQHNPTYDQGASSESKARFRTDFVQRVLALTDVYREVVDERTHVGNIVHLADDLSKVHGHLLKANRLRIGTAQKALNLHLKTVWCLDPSFAEPPHCPVDRIILQAAGLQGTWTKLDGVDVYNEWIVKLRSYAQGAGYPSLAQWELNAWAAS